METIYKCSINVKESDRFQSARQCKWRYNKWLALTTLHRTNKAAESDDKSFFYDEFVTITNNFIFRVIVAVYVN